MSSTNRTFADAKMLDLTQLPAAIAPDYWPEPFWPVCFLLLLSFIRFLHIFSYPETPKVTVAAKAKEDNVKEVLAKCPILSEKYDPPLLWGRNGHLQTATYGVLGHSTLKRTYDRRHAIKIEDGSTVLFDVFEPIEKHSSEGDFTLALCPGVANTSESNYIRTLVHYAQDHGYRCAVLNHLGALKDVTLTGNHIFNYGRFAELEAMMDRLMEVYPTTRFISIGFSMGANLTTRYLAHMDPAKKDRILMGLSVCQGYCATTCAPLYHQWENGRRIYNYIIAENVKRLLRRNYDRAVAPHVEAGIVDENRLWGATSILVMDEVYSRRIWGFKDIDEYYKAVSCLQLIPNITTPMIFVNTADDPIVPSELFEPVAEICRDHPRHGFVLLKHGGHLGFLEGRSIKPNSVTWLDRFIVQMAEGATQVFA
uniref:AB hydrolase-1 domain-containing protein n=1 Tax=Panagrellus redivivus TaxID=6233 RepID=A0A7E4ZS13_PANRE